MGEEGFVSRAGQKLQHALEVFGVDVTRWVCADLGANVGGFVDCLLQRGALKVYAIDTGYGALEWKLRKDQRVVDGEDQCDACEIAGEDEAGEHRCGVDEAEEYFAGGQGDARGGGNGGVAD